MPGPVPPFVRSLIVCEDIVADPDKPESVSLMRLIASIRSIGDPPYPLLHREFCVFVQVSGCRGPKEVKVEIREVDGGQTVFATPARLAPFRDDPVVLHGLQFRIRNCLFPRPGFYSVQFWYDGEMVAEQQIVLR